MCLEWFGNVSSNSLNDWARDAIHDLINAAKAGQWDRVFEILAAHPEFVNATRPDSLEYYAPLHHAAWIDAPPEVIRRLLDAGAWRTHRNGKRERPVDVAIRKSHRHLVELLEPQIVSPVPTDELAQLQRYFHVVIRGRVNELVVRNSPRLPELEPLTEFPHGTAFWFAVPGMFGGFRYWLEHGRDSTTLLTESWSRIGDGSGQRHEISFNSCRLVDEGFV